MTTITKYVVALVLCLFVSNIGAQEQGKTEVLKDSMSTTNQILLKKLKRQREKIEAEEREFLKVEIENINKQLDDKRINADEAEKLKKEAAKKRAANIEDRLAIIDKKIALIERNPDDDSIEEGDISFIGFSTDGEGKAEFGISIKSGKKTPPKYDIRTKNHMIFGIGFNNAIGDGQNLGDTPYKLGGSGFIELGWQWQTRIFKNSNFARINYGFSFQWNKLDIKDNQYFVENGNQTTLQTFPIELKQAKFRVTNLVIPVHLEFGGSTKKDYGNRIRYSTHNKFKVGIGGYGGLRLGSMQKLRFEDTDGDRVKEKQKRNFNATNFVYGISGYIGFSDILLYAKYDLNPLFKDQAFDQHNISLGLRWAWD